MKPKLPKSEYHTPILRRTRQTLGVIRAHCPDLKVALYGHSELATLAEKVKGLVTAREGQNVAFRRARRAFRDGNAALRTLTLKVPLLIEGQFKPADSIPAMLPAIWAIVPRTPALAMKRAKALLPVWKSADAALAKRTPPGPRITQEGVGAVEFAQHIEALPALVQAGEQAATDLRAARIALRETARLLDRWNKRFYGKLRSEARSDAALKAALKQIEAEPPSTRGKKGKKPAPPAEHPLKTETVPAADFQTGDSL